MLNNNLNYSYLVTAKLLTCKRDVIRSTKLEINRIRVFNQSTILWLVTKTTKIKVTIGSHQWKRSNHHCATPNQHPPWCRTSLTSTQIRNRQRTNTPLVIKPEINLSWFSLRTLTTIIFGQFVQILWWEQYQTKKTYRYVIFIIGRFIKKSRKFSQG